MMLFRKFGSNTDGRLWIKKIKLLKLRSRRVWHTNLKFLRTVIHLNNCWQEADICFLNIVTSGLLHKFSAPDCSLSVTHL